MTEETPNARIFYPHQYLLYKTHSSFTPIWMSVDIFCVPQMIFWTLMKTFWCWCWGSSVKTISLIATKHDHETWNKTTPIERLGIRLKANDLMMFLEEMSRVYVMNEVLVQYFWIWLCAINIRQSVLNCCIELKQQSSPLGGIVIYYIGGNLHRSSSSVWVGLCIKEVCGYISGIWNYKEFEIIW